MQLPIQSLSFALLASAALALPIQAEEGEDSFSERSPPPAYEELPPTYEGPPPTYRSLPQLSQGPAMTVPLTQKSDGKYYVQLIVTSKNHWVDAVLDTVGGETVFRPANPKNKADPGVNFDISTTFRFVREQPWLYEDDNHKSYKQYDATETVSFVNGDKRWPLRNAPITYIWQLSQIAKLGLGSRLTDVKDYRPYIINSLIDAKYIKYPSFSIYLDKSAAYSKGNLIFGGVDHSKFYGELLYTDMYKKLIDGLYNTFTLNSMSVSGKVVSGSESSVLARVNPDFPGILFSKSIYSAFMKTLPKSLSRSSIACDAKGPDIVLNVGGKNFNIPFSNLISQKSSKLLGKSSTTCSLDIGTVYKEKFNDVNVNLIELGRAFMKENYVDIDFQKNQIGFARARSGNN